MYIPQTDINVTSKFSPGILNLGTAGSYRTINIFQNLDYKDISSFYNYKIYRLLLGSMSFTLQALSASSAVENSMKAKPLILLSCLYLGKLKSKEDYT